MRFMGATSQPQVLGLEALPGSVNYFIGNDPRKWQTHIPTYARGAGTCTLSAILRERTAPRRRCASHDTRTPPGGRVYRVRRPCVFVRARPRGRGVPRIFLAHEGRRIGRPHAQGAASIVHEKRQGPLVSHTPSTALLLLGERARGNCPSPPRGGNSHTRVEP